MIETHPNEAAKKNRLHKYIKLRGQIERLQDELARRRNRQYIPATPESDGSKRNPGASDRMANAVISRMSFEEKAKAKMQAYAEEMEKIEDAVLDLEDGLEQQVILLRYITGINDGTKPMPWQEVALTIYGNNDDKDMQAVYRIHGRALQHIKLEVSEE